MSWWKKSSSQAGQIMQVSELHPATYKQLLSLFGKPHGGQAFSDGRIHVAEWRLEILATKFTIKLNADKAARIKWHEKEGKTKYKIPSVNHKIVDFAEVIGNGVIYGSIVEPLLKMIMSKKYNHEAAKNTIQFVFEDMEKHN